MVKIKGPMGSVNASGSLADVATFASWKGRQYARRNVIPKNPQSAPQISVRGIMAFLAAQWSGLSAPNKATWIKLAAQTQISPFNAYTAHNLDRWQQFLPPTQAYPATKTGTQANAYITTVVGGVGHVLVTYADEDINDGWAMLFFRSPTPAFESARTNLITVLPIDYIGFSTYRDSPLAPGTYYYRERLFTTSAKLADQSFTYDATVT